MKTENMIRLYAISEDDIETMENIIDYLSHHNKNLTNNQDDLVYQLDMIVKKLRDRFTGYDYK